MNEDAGLECCICKQEATKQAIWTGLWFCDRRECWDRYVQRSNEGDTEITEMLDAAPSFIERLLSE